MDLADYLGMKANFTLGNSKMINFTAKGIINGVMVNTMLGSGLKASSMEKVKYFKEIR